MNRFGKIESEGKYNIIAPKIAWLLGVSEENLGFPEVYEADRFPLMDQFNHETPVRIIRYLCCIRTELFRNNKTIFEDIRSGNSILTNGPVRYIQSLYELHIDLYHNKRNINAMQMDISQKISERINNVREYFPDWVEWEYIKNLFLMPNGFKEQGIKDAAALYYANIDAYPYKAYLNWIPRHDLGNILSSDMKFLVLLYQMNHDHFTRFDKIKSQDDVKQESIDGFLTGESGSVLVIDGENSDPYRMAGAVKTLGKKAKGIKKIILLNDTHAPSGWNMFDKFTDIPVETHMVDRIMEGKSMADVVFASKICEEYYKNNVGSFIIGSSDSDFMGVMASVKANFMVMGEHGKFSPRFKAALEERNIPYCFLDDICSDTSEFMENTILASVIDEVNSRIGELDMNALINTSLDNARLTLTDREKDKMMGDIIKSLKFNLLESGKTEVICA